MEKVIIFDFGSQYTQLIARRLREKEVYCEIHPFSKKIDFSEKIKGVILSGSPASVLKDDAPSINLTPFLGKIPILAICYGAQYITHHFGGEVAKSENREYGRAKLIKLDNEALIFKNIQPNKEVWMSHADTIIRLPENATTIASTEDVTIAGFQIKNKNIYALQFHPEVYHSEQGDILLRNFIFDICKMNKNWTSQDFIEKTVSELSEKLGSDKVIMALSGGVDSTVAAVLIHKAIGDNLQCIFVDNGLLRKNEYNEVLSMFKKLHLSVKGVDAKQLFYKKLLKIVDPEGKRKIIGETFIDIFEAEAKTYNNAKWLAQGTIYPDVIESVSATGGPSATIKSHHNVGGLPEDISFEIVEPLNLLFKDEVRKVGRELGLSSEFVQRHPFPGPGLGIRILGDITEEKVKLLQEADSIFINQLKKAALYDEVWQAGVILLPVKSVGVMGDERTYEHVVALRAVSSTDGMTADWCHLPYKFIAKVSNEIINKVRGINRVVYDVSSKPPATIEWE